MLGLLPDFVGAEGEERPSVAMIGTIHHQHITPTCHHLRDGEGKIVSFRPGGTHTNDSTGGEWGGGGGGGVSP